MKLQAQLWRGALSQVSSWWTPQQNPQNPSTLCTNQGITHHVYEHWFRRAHHQIEHTQKHPAVCAWG
jgi:imidazoleglycerol phosphate dehydratase HisB